MIILLDTSTPVCRLTVVNDNQYIEYEWQADRQLAHGLLRWLTDRLADNNAELRDITGIGVYLGPGSFTGLRIGITVLNTLSDSLKVPIVGGTGDVWAKDVVDRLSRGENDHIALPFYGNDAHITTPRK